MFVCVCVEVERNVVSSLVEARTSFDMEAEKVKLLSSDQELFEVREGSASLDLLLFVRKGRNEV